MAFFANQHSASGIPTETVSRAVIYSLPDSLASHHYYTLTVQQFRDLCRCVDTVDRDFLAIPQALELDHPRRDFL